MLRPFSLRARREHVERRRRQLLSDALRRQGFAHRDEPPDDDVVIVGFPKSGNTWLQIMMAALVFGLDVERTPFSLICEAVPDLSDREYFRRHAAAMFYKSHALPHRRYRRVVYLLRDGRDVMVSYRHYREVVDRRPYDLETFVSRDFDMWPCHWAEHVEAWADNPFGSELILVKYEDLVANPTNELRRICTFSGLQRSDEQLDAIVIATAFDRLREKERREGAIPVPAYQGATPFFRRGQVGSYLDEMSPQALFAFLDHAEPTLSRTGYIPDRGPTGPSFEPRGLSALVAAGM